VIVFIVVVVLIAMDFWITKNISGRLLVGLRWWNEVREDGSNEWIFESLQETKFDTVESKIFWISIVIFPLFWIIFLITQLFKFGWNWSILCALGFVLSAANVTGYIKCARDARSRVKDMATEFVVTNAIKKL